MAFLLKSAPPRSPARAWRAAPGRLRYAATHGLCLAGLWLLATGASATPPESERAAPAPTAAPEAVAQPSYRDLDCVITPSLVVDLGAPVPGVLQAVYADATDEVKSGQPLARLESGVEEATVNLARARAGLTTDIDLKRRNADFELRRQTRNQALYRQQVLPANDMDQLETSAAVAALEARRAEDDRRLAGLELKRAEELLDRRLIRSPIDGVVMQRFRSAGEYVEDQPLLRLARLDPLHVDVIVPVDLLGRVRRGMQADVHAEISTGQTYRAVVDRIDPVADAASGTFSVRLLLGNPDGRVPAGLRCHADLLPEAPLAETGP